MQGQGAAQPRREEAVMKRVQAERPGHNLREEAADPHGGPCESQAPPQRLGEASDPPVGPVHVQAPPQRPGEAADPPVGPGEAPPQRPVEAVDPREDSGESVERQPLMNGGRASSAGGVSYSNGHVDPPLGVEETPSLLRRGVQRVRRLYREHPKTVLALVLAVAVVLALVVLLIITLTFGINSISSSGTDQGLSTPSSGYSNTSTANASGTDPERSTPRPGVSTSTASEWETAGNVSFYRSREKKDFTGSRNHCEGLSSRLIRDSDTQVVKKPGLISEDTWINRARTRSDPDCYVYSGSKYEIMACDTLRHFVCVKDEKAS